MFFQRHPSFHFFGWLALPPLVLLNLVLAQPLAPNDLWYHVRAGEFIARTGAVPTTNGMSLGVPLETPYFYQSWLAELLLFCTLNRFGLDGLQLLRAFCFVGGLSFVMAAAWRANLRMMEKSQEPEQRNSFARAACATATAVLLALALLSNNLDLRPQSFSVLLLGIYLWALGEWDANFKLAWGAVVVIITWIWANTHGAFVIALLLIGALAVGALLEKNGSKAQRHAILGVFCAAAVCLNPHGLELFAYVGRLSTDTISQKYIQEWQSPRLDEPAGMLFAGSALVLLLAGARANWVRRAWWPGALVLLVMGWRDQRAIIWFALWLPLLLGPAFTAKPFALSSATAPDSSSDKSGTLFPRAGVVLSLCLLLSGIALLPSLKAKWPWPASYRAKFAPTPSGEFAGSSPLLLSRQHAVEPAAYLLAHPPRGRLFTDMVAGSYLTWATHPRIKPLCDPRIELFPVAFWEDYARLSNGPPDAARELRERGFSDVLLDETTQKPLVEKLRRSPQWREVARGGPTFLFRLQSEF